jgi:hypothetical protein
MPVLNNDLLSRHKDCDHRWPSVRPHQVLQNVMFRRAAPRPRLNCPSRVHRYCRRIERQLARLGETVQAIHDIVQYKKNGCSVMVVIHMLKYKVEVAMPKLITPPSLSQFGWVHGIPDAAKGERSIESNSSIANGHCR